MRVVVTGWRSSFAAEGPYFYRWAKVEVGRVGPDCPQVDFKNDQVLIPKKTDTEEN